MDPALAKRHGVLYVHLAALAIDLDRIASIVDQTTNEGDWPFGWEVFLTEVALLAEIDPEAPTSAALIEDLCRSVFEATPRGASAARGVDDAGPLGAQVVFAVHDAVERGNWPAALVPLFESWPKDGDADLVEELAPLWDEPEVAAADLAAACLALELDPPIAPPTRAILEAMVAVEAGDEPADDTDEASDAAPEASPAGRSDEPGT